MHLSPSDSPKLRAQSGADSRPSLTLLSRAQSIQTENPARLRAAATANDEEADLLPAITPSGAFVPVVLVRDYAAYWVDDCIAEGQSKRTTDSKLETMTRFLWFLDRNNMKRVGAFEVRRFLTYAKNGHLESGGRWESNNWRAKVEVGGRALQIYFTHIRKFFEWLVVCELTDRNPLAGQKQPKAAKSHVSPLTIEEIALLLNAIPRARNRLRNEAMLYLLLDTGVRVAELCALQVNDIDLARRVAIVRAGKGNKSREVWFGPDTGRILRQYLKKWAREEDQALFYSKLNNGASEGLTPSGVQRTLQRLAHFAGLSTRRVSPHNFRHTFATEFIRSGGTPKVLQMLLGHEDMTMTYRYVTLAEADAAVQHRQHSPARLLREKRKK